MLGMGRICGSITLTRSAIKMVVVGRVGSIGVEGGRSTAGALIFLIVPR